MRRHVNKGQQAMGLAMIYPEPERGRGKKDEALKDALSTPFSKTRLLQARSVLRHSLPLAQEVIRFLESRPPHRLGLWSSPILL
jgi:hypothetical protein